ncbi:unnamed protein product [Paramecium sonneborni]|uniref:Uncharacterized protein n=1 Tax=Paramecium sonneborni TaxID=65129 RepID=A0A8S1MYR5_9CILI|nr:unnamed protein product [Paramecium sonneborni]
MLFLLALLSNINCSIYDKIKYIENQIDLAQNVEYFEARKRFLDGVKIKNIFEMDKDLIDIHLFHLKQLHYPSSQLLVCKSSDNEIMIINQLGSIIAQYNHSSNILMTDILHNVDEFYIGLYDADKNLTILNMTIIDKNIKEEPIDDIRRIDKNGYYHEIDLTWASSFQLNYKATSILVNSGRNTRVFLVGDENGAISYYFQNGTLKNKNTISSTPIMNLLRRHPHIMFQTEKIIGFLNSVSLTVVTPKCDQPAASIVSIYQENIYSQNIYVLLSNQDILIYQIKSGKHHECSISYKIPTLQKLKNIRVINSYLIGYDRTLQIYNTSLYKSLYQDEVLYLTSLDDQRLWYQYYSIRSHKINAQTSNAYEFYTSNNKTTIRQIELTHIPMPQSSSFSLMESFRFPMILVAIFIVFIFQFWQKKKKTDHESDELSAETKKKIDDMVKQYKKYDKPE